MQILFVVLSAEELWLKLLNYLITLNDRASAESFR